MRKYLKFFYMEIKQIKEALQQKYPNLGLSEEVFERVASSVGTFITTDEQLTSFVAGAEGMLKQYQSIGDKARQEAATAKRELEELKAKNDADSAGDDNKEGDKTTNPAELAATIAAAIKQAVDPLTTELTALKDAARIKNSVNEAKTTFYANDYVKKFKSEADEAWERAIEVNEASGNTMKPEELNTKAMAYFNKSVQKMGIDTSKPFQSEEHSDDTNDWEAERKRKVAQKMIPESK